MKNLLSDVLATKRLTRLILDDYILNTPRQKLLEKFPPETTLTGYLLTCPWCVSIYAGASVATLRYLAPELATPISTALAASEVTGLLNEHGL